MQTVNTSTYRAVINIGLKRGYDNELYSKDTLVTHLQAYQTQLTETKNIYLSASVSECEIILHNHREPHVKLEFINYPSFPISEDVFKKEIINLTEHLMHKLEQNRVVVVFNDKTVMLQLNDKLDPGVNVKHP